jgi:serine/threonine protein kinase
VWYDDDDARGVGCIFAEMVTGRPLFCGSSDQDQLMKIFKIMGTPTRSEWSGMVDLPEYKNVETYPRYEGKKLKGMLPRLSKSGIDLIERMLQSDPQKRISAKEAMRHPYFADLQGAQTAM